MRLDVDPALRRGLPHRRRRQHRRAPAGRGAARWRRRRRARRTSSPSAVFVYEELAPVTAKGKAEPVAAWLAKAPLARAGSRLAQAARSRRSSAARSSSPASRRSSTKAVATSAPQFVLIVGEPGIGKSRLVAELVRLDRRRARDDHLAPGPLPALRRGRHLLGARRDRQGAGRHPARATTPGAVEAKLDADPARRAPTATGCANRLRALLGLEAPQATREENFAAWLRFLEDLARREPAVLVFEDLHWADEALLAFLEYLATHLDGCAAARRRHRAPGALRERIPASPPPAPA